MAQKVQTFLHGRHRPAYYTLLVFQHFSVNIPTVAPYIDSIRKSPKGDQILMFRNGLTD